MSLDALCINIDDGSKKCSCFRVYMLRTGVNALCMYLEVWAVLCSWLLFVCGHIVHICHVVSEYTMHVGVCHVW